MNEYLTPPTVPIGLLMDKDTGLQEHIMGMGVCINTYAYTMGIMSLITSTLMMEADTFSKQWTATPYLHS
jgi:hypothetical protein